jgi:hypothetical protein
MPSGSLCVGYVDPIERSIRRARSGIGCCEQYAVERHAAMKVVK